MNEQGATPTGHEDDWWRQLYDDSTGDTGPAPARDSLDDRFASASGALTTGGAPRGPAAGGEPDRDRPAGGTGTTPAPGTSPTGPSPGAPGPFSGPPVPSAPSVPRQDPRRTTPAAPRPPATGAETGPTVPGAEAGPAVPGAEARPSAPGAGAPQAAPGTDDGPPAPAVGPGAPAGATAPAPPAYDADPRTLPPAGPDALADLVPDTVLDGARYGTCTLRAVSTRGDAARLRGEPRGDFLLTARFGTGAQALVLVAMATGARGTPGAHRAAAEACHHIGRAVGRSHTRLAQDLRAARRGDLKSGLHRLTDRSLGMLRASAAQQGLDPGAHTASLRCLLLPADPQSRTRVFFGVGEGGLFRLRDGRWEDIEPGAPGTGGDHLTLDLGTPVPPGPYEQAPPPAPFRFRASVAVPGDTLLMCTAGLAAALRGAPEAGAYLRRRWSAPAPPGLAGFLADVQVRAEGHTDDRTAAAVWER